MIFAGRSIRREVALKWAPNHRANNLVSVEERQTRERGLSRRICFSLRSLGVAPGIEPGCVTASCGNDLCGYAPRVIYPSTP